MTFRTETVELALSGGWKRVLDFLELTKPRLVLMILLTTFVGFYLGTGQDSDYLRLLHTLIGTALAAGGTLALNQVLERETDARMERTRRRPLPEGRVQPGEALVFGVVCCVAGLLFLARGANGLSAVLTGVVVVTYLGLYTPLKQRSPLCMVAGAVPGALPPVIGWAAARNELGLWAWFLFALLFLWQMPHTLSIATLYREDFARAGIRFLPVVDPDGRRTGRQVAAYSFALFVISLSPTFLGFASLVYGISAALLGGGLLVFAAALARTGTALAGRRLLLATLAYLPLLLFFLVWDGWV